MSTRPAVRRQSSGDPADDTHDRGRGIGRRRSSNLRRAAISSICVFALGALAAGCSLSAEGDSEGLSVLPEQPSMRTGLDFSSRAAATSAPDVVVAYSGHAEQLTVPAHATSAYVVVSGGSGGLGPNAVLGLGATVIGSLDVTGGDVLTVAAGGKGGDETTNKHPGAGGWSIPPYAGGRGGSGHGSQTYDGAGGGGASVILLNDTPVVVAGGGGGQGGIVTQPAMFASYNEGGSAGAAAGSAGQGDAGGKGGSSARPALDTTGGSYSGKAIKGGGGGGGGGRYPGAGGGAAFDPGPEFGSGGGGGGGGSSLYDALDGATVLVGKDRQLNNLGHRGNGQTSITWQYSPDNNSTYVFTKVHATTPQALEAKVAGATTPPAQVDTHTLAYRQDGGVSAQQLWEWDTTGVTTGGQLRNRDSGLCLEVNGNSGNVDQWTCDPTSANHRWRIVTETNGVTRLRVDLPAGDTPRPAGTYFLATTSASDKTVNGTTLTLTLDSQDERTEWSALPQT